ncbi:RNA-binding domain-containing protein [Chloropicon primus]|uniref:RNA-binding domain-containing protein n=2 Tax=Chloropicon primus TaxID=1764295 RepID=A0A5B8MC92_9CHLO|nr:RNA-binding domain-containing protein [Chloropicon primus]UPQ96870.1 RNA-binding domain-containing protein [Chloropicon primus]|eukprot:QDZ17654.1 RNA-binding domain-containing protein [Chloropicon primus]
MDDPAVKRKVILYPESRDVSFDEIQEAVEGVVGKVRGANPLGNGGWILRMSNATEAIELLQAAKKGKVIIGGKKVSAQRPSQGQATDANRIPLGGVCATQARAGPFRKDRDNKRQRACTVVIAHVKPSTKELIQKVVAEAGKVGEVKTVKGPLSPEEITEEEISLSQIEGKRVGSFAASPGIILAEFGAVAHAFAAVKLLHGKSVKGLHKPLWARQLGGEGAKIKYWRIIVRNLPFKIDETKFKKHMSLKNELFVWDVHIPKGADGRVRGFGFIGYICRSDAEKAIKKLNGTKLEGRTIVLDWTVGKKEFQEGMKSQEPGAVATENDEDDEDSDGEGEEAGEYNEGDEGNDPESAVGNVDEESAMMERIVSSFQANSTEKPESAKQDHQGARAPMPPKSKEEEEEAIGRTVFVSHIPLNAYKMDVQRVMEKFGQVSSCRMVIDKKARKFSGKAFVEFAKAASAKKASEAHSDAKSGKREKVSINGHIVNIYLALNKNGIQDLSDQIKRKTNRPDKRNLYLADEGHIDPESGAGEGMSEGDLRARERSHREKLEKLKNPNMFVSKTRLMIRNLPREMTKGQLRALCIKAVKERATKARPKVTQCKIMYTENPNTKVLKSSERGFIEFTDHEHAICCLRMLNNNPSTFTVSRRPIVEFAVENTLKVQKLKKRASTASEKLALRKSEASTPRGGDEREEGRNGKKSREGGKKEKTAKETAGEDGCQGSKGSEKKRKSSVEKPDRKKPKKSAAKDERGDSVQREERPARAKKNKKRKAEEKDNLDDLIQNYQAKYFNTSLDY